MNMFVITIAMFYVVVVLLIHVTLFGDFQGMSEAGLDSLFDCFVDRLRERL